MSKYIVLGGIGEMEVYIDTPADDMLAQLQRVSEDCGYLAHKGSWGEWKKEIWCYPDMGIYLLTYLDNKLDRIEKVTKRIIYDRSQKEAQS